ncbi:MAG: hypothetical protein AAB337_03860 [Patescibacteria group bacterium]
MLMNRFPFLSLVPTNVLVEGLLDRSHARVRATIERTKIDHVTFELTPKADASSVVQLLDWQMVSHMVVGVSYSVEIDESGAVSSAIGGEPLRQVPAPIEFLLRCCHRQLRNLACQYVDELRSLPSVASAQECMRGNAVSYLDLLRKIEMFYRAFSPPPRVRSVCMDCFQREAGLMIPMRGNAQRRLHLDMSGVRNNRHVASALSHCMGEDYSLDIFPAFVLIPHEQLVFSEVFYRLYEAGMNRCLEDVFEDERDIYIAKRLMEGTPPIES